MVFVSMAAVYQLKIKYDQDKFRVFFLDAKGPVSFPLEDKHVVNDHHKFVHLHKHKPLKVAKKTP